MSKIIGNTYAYCLQHVQKQLIFGMLNFRVTLWVLLLFSVLHAHAQDTIPKGNRLPKVSARMKNMPMLGKRVYTFNYKALSQFNPTQENPSGGWQSPTRSKEVILSDFQPILTLDVFNDFERKFTRKDGIAMKYYLAFRPHFRLYRKQSIPVSMPSYRVFMGVRHVYRIKDRHLLGYGLESGHYSNGQSGCPLSSAFGSFTQECDSLKGLTTDDSPLSDMINRSNGDFSTNLTELSGNYRFIADTDTFGRPKELHSFNLGIMLFHDRLFGIFDMGGYEPWGISLYGHWRFHINYTYSHHWQSGYRISLSEDIELIQGAHPAVNPFRSETTATLFLPRHMGIYISYTYGHDDYNLRMVDTGHQFGIGMVWDMFAPVDVETNQ